LNWMIPLGEIVFALLFGLIFGARLRSVTGEGRVRVGYIFGILGAVFLYGAYDFYYYSIGDLVMERTSYWPGLSGAFLFSLVGIIIGRETLGRRLGRKGGEN